MDNPSTTHGAVNAIHRAHRSAFTLIELLVVVAIIGLLISILLPTLSSARVKARGAKCLANLHVLGHGIAIYAAEERDVLPPGRLPKAGDCGAYAHIAGGRKYRPTFTAMMSNSVGAPPFEDPKACVDEYDRFGEPWDRQNYSYEVYVCPEVADWTDERNGSYGYNYHFLGNSRLSNPEDQNSYKNWPVKITWVRYPSRTVAAADCMGTAAGVPPDERGDYTDIGREKFPGTYGDEGFNLDPPRIDLANGGEIAGHHYSPQLRSAAHERHHGLANVLWVDGHVATKTLLNLGYRFAEDGAIGLDGENTLWTGNGSDEAWTPRFSPR